MTHLRIFTALLLTFTASTLDCQINLNKTLDLHGEGRFYSGTTIAVCDLNNDFRDDLVILDKGTEMYVSYQNALEDTMSYDFVGHVNDDAQWAITVADIDKNGWRDVIIAGAFDGVKVYFQDQGVFTLERMIDSIFYAQAMNAVDINNDGWTDIIVCNDNNYNIIFWNNNGILEPDTTSLFRTLPVDSSGGNYGSVWSDVDGDGDIDFFIAKCYANATKETDARRINQLYVNQGNGVWTEQAAARGIASGAQSWTGDFGDIDNDGDMDLFVTNHDRKAQLYRNDGNGYFTEVTDQTGVSITGPVIQGLLIDLDLDGYLDIVTGGVPHYMYINNGDWTFKEIAKPFDLYDVVSFARGDLNTNGHPDLYSAHPKLINLYSNLADRSWINHSSGNYIDVHLKGTVSNPDGIGAKVLLYINGQAMTREIRAGESYGIHNSYVVNFGLGDAINADSMVVIWPSGIRTKVQNIPANGYVFCLEGEEAFTEREYILPRKVAICTGDSLWLFGPNATHYAWSTGDTSQGIWVHDRGVYSLEVTTLSGNVIALPNTVIELDPKVEASIIVLQGDTINCAGEEVVLSAKGGEIISWSNQMGTDEISITESGDYWVSVQGQCQSDTSESLHIGFEDGAGFIRLANDTILKPGAAVLIADGNDTHWYSDSQSTNLVVMGDSLKLAFVEYDTMFFARDQVSRSFNPMSMGKAFVDADEPYHKEGLNGTTWFEVQQDMMLNSVEVFTDFPGKRTLILIDRRGNMLYKSDFDVEGGADRLQLNWFIPASDEWYRIGTLDSTNNAEFGHRSPKLQSCDRNINYPYGIEGFCRIVKSQYGTEVYNYFYNWEVQRATMTCFSPVEKLIVDVKMSTTVSEEFENTLLVYPNPVLDILEVKSEEKVIEQIHLYSLEGRLITHIIQANPSQVAAVDVTGLLQGTYIVTITTTTGVFQKKIIVQ